MNEEEFDSMNVVPTHNSIASFDFEREIRLVDTDSTGLAHFGSYIRMMEETEYAFLRSRGLRVVLHDERGTMGFPRLHASLKVHQPLCFGDVVNVRLHLMDVDGKKVEYQFQIFDANHDLVVDGKFIAAFCRFPDNKPPYAMLIPEKVIEALVGNASPIADQHTQPIAIKIQSANT